MPLLILYVYVEMKEKQTKIQNTNFTNLKT